jgi:phosphatidylinositol glycan class B
MADFAGTEEAPGTAARARSGLVRLPRERWFAPVGLLGLVLLAIGLRLVPVVFVPSLNWGDEIFQTIEPAHRLVYGFGLVPWEFQLGMRSWLLPGVIAGLIELSRLIGDGPAYYLPAFAAAFALLASAPVACVFLWARRWYGLPGALVGAATVAIAPELVYFGARALSEVVAAHILVIGFYLIEPGYPVSSRRRVFAAGTLLGLVCLLRIQLAPAVALVSIWSAWRHWRVQFYPLLAGGFAALAFGAILDWATLGYPLASLWRNVLYNLFFGVNADFGTEPWNYYLLGELAVWFTGGFALVAIAAVGARRLPALLLAAIVIVLVHSCIAHKEYRFIYPAVALLTVLAGIGLAQLVDWGTWWLTSRGLRAHTAVAAAAAIVFGYWAFTAFTVWTGDTLAQLRQRASDNLSAMSFAAHSSTLCGLGLYGLGGKDWVWYGGYTHLHRRVPMYWPKDETQLAHAARAFDTLVYTAPLPAKLDFTTQKCFGRVCVAHRPGTCEAQPMSAMPFPEPIADLAPPREKFEALPNSAALTGQ